MDCIVHGVTKSWAQLIDFHFQVTKGVGSFTSTVLITLVLKLNIGSRVWSSLLPLESLSWLSVQSSLRSDESCW